jgi:hypothetical protein
MSRIFQSQVCIAIGISLLTRPQKPWGFISHFLPSNRLHSHSARFHQRISDSTNSLTHSISQLVHPSYSLSSTDTIVTMTPTKNLKRLAEEPATPSKGQAKPPKKKQCRKPRCIVCGTKKYFNQFPGQAKVSSHDHGANVCRSCYVSHLKVEIDSKIWDEVACPECPVRLTYNEIENMADAEDFAKWVIQSHRLLTA